MWCRVGWWIAAAALMGAGVGGCAPPGSVDHRTVRRYAFRAISGFSMGSMSAAMLGLRHHEQFDMIAPLGGALDLGLFLHLIQDEMMGGFCVPPVAGQMCPAKPGGTSYERMNVGPQSQGGFDRKSMFKAFADLSIAMGNVVSFNPEHPYLPAGVLPEYLMRPRVERCSRPVRLEGYFDWRYNPEGRHPVITYCEDNGVERGVFDPDVDPSHPVEIALAVDLNDNGRRDSGEPVLLRIAERFDDWGEDAVPSEREPGYHPADNPDPSGDDYHRLDNPFGTEGNHRWNEGEPYLDYGLDGVSGTADSPHDWGEGNGRYDLNPNLLRAGALTNPARLLGNLTGEQLDRLDFYIDVGIWDHLRFLQTCESFAGILDARGRPVDIRDTFDALAKPEAGGVYDVRQLDWDHIGRDVLVRYGHWDATPEMIENGDGGHVGDISQLLKRFWTLVLFVSLRWPDGDFEPVESKAQQIEATYQSTVLGQERRYVILLPPGYEEHPQARYPVLYLLHGLGMQPEDLTLSALFTGPWMREGFLQKFIIVLPDGSCQDDCFSGTFFLNQSGRHLPPRRYEDDFFQKLIPHIDRTYRTRAAAEIALPSAGLAPPAFE